MPGTAKTYEIRETLNHSITNYKDKTVQVHRVQTDTKDALFRKVYAMRRSARYDSSRRYEFETRALEEEYRDWKDKNETIEMYYGNATVD